MTSGPLSGRRAVVTGAGRGLGAAIALELASAGADVGLLVRDPARATAVAAGIRQRGRRPAVAVCDAANLESVDRAVRKLAAELGDVGLLVNNAAVVTPVGSAATLDIGEWARTIQVNLVSAMVAARAVLPGMLGMGRGTIVNISSGAATPPGMPLGSAYTVSKAGLESLTEHMNAELEPEGIAVRVVRPGRVDTRMQEQLRDEGLVGPVVAARHRGWLADGELLAPTVPARLVRAVCAEPWRVSGPISVYDPSARRLLALEATTSSAWPSKGGESVG